MSIKQLIGPFSQAITLRNLQMKGPLSDAQLEIVNGAGIVVENGIIAEVVAFEQAAKGHYKVFELEEDLVAFPGMIDCHTHLCFAGSRAGDYAIKVAGGSYGDILQNGGGIHDTVAKTRAASESELVDLLAQRASRHLQEGVTTIEVKSGYGLNKEAELKMLRAIRRTALEYFFDLVPTCLAAHVKPREFEHASEYLAFIVNEILPEVKKEGLSQRVDIFIDNAAFDVGSGHEFLQKAAAMGFQLTVHADQFSTGGARLAADLLARSADHLESSSAADIQYLAQSSTVGVALPGASLGLGMPFAPARSLLDRGGCMAIASDWNPGSAPMGDLLMQAAVLGAAQKLTMAETWAGVTFRAAKALGLADRGTIEPGKRADIIAFPVSDYREVLYQQGKVKPSFVWKAGLLME